VAEGRYSPSWSTSQLQGRRNPPTHLAPGGHEPPQNNPVGPHVYLSVLVVDDDVEVADDRDVDELDDDEVEDDVDGPIDDELLDDVDVVVLVVAIVVGGCAVLEVLVGFGADELVLDVGAGVSVVEVTGPPIVLDVLVDVGSCAGRVVLVVVEARGRLVEVVVVPVASA
jgi:hypothetical protein